MSTGAFELSKYESNTGDIHPILVQPETVTLVVDEASNDAPEGAVTSNAIRAKARKGNREYGIGARSITIRMPAAPTGGYLANSILTVPILQQSVWDGISVTDTGTYNGNAVTVVSKKDEQRL